MQIWANWGRLRGANILSTASRITTKIRREPDMTSTREDTVFEISEIIFNMRIFATEVIRTAKIV